MAISASFELRETPGSTASAIYGAFLKSYTVIDFDYTLKRSLDKTGRPSSIATIDFIKLTIRGTKEITSKFHEWINTPDKLMDGVIQIYDSTGYFAAWAQDAIGGETIDEMGVVGGLVTDEVEDNMNAVMDNASHYRDGENSDDIFDEMDRAELLSYIDSNQLDIKTDSSTSDDSIRERIRYYKKISKMSLEQLKAEAASKGITLPDNPTIQDCLNKLIEYNNKQTAKDKSNPAKEAAYKTADKAKQATAKTASSAANAVVKSVLESARSITIKNAYCVSLREHFHNDPNSQGTLDTTYPWILEIGIKPGSIEINGANIGGVSGYSVIFEFFKP